MKLYRLVPSHHSSNDNGEGGLKTSGRWHELGTPVLYFGSSVSLCLLEKIVRGDPGNTLHLRLIEIDDAKIAPVGSLPRHWDLLPDSPDTVKKWGSKRLGKEQIFKVPSAIIPQEFNVVASPSVKYLSDTIVPFKLDPRIREQLGWDKRFN